MTMTLPTQYEAGDSVDESADVEVGSESVMETVPMEQSTPAVEASSRPALDVALRPNQKKQCVITSAVRVRLMCLW